MLLGPVVFQSSDNQARVGIQRLGDPVETRYLYIDKPAEKAGFQFCTLKQDLFAGHHDSA